MISHLYHFDKVKIVIEKLLRISLSLSTGHRCSNIRIYLRKPNITGLDCRRLPMGHGPWPQDKPNQSGNPSQPKVMNVYYF